MSVLLYSLNVCTTVLLGLRIAPVPLMSGSTTWLKWGSVQPGKFYKDPPPALKTQAIFSFKEVTKKLSLTLPAQYQTTTAMFSKVLSVAAMATAALANDKYPISRFQNDPAGIAQSGSPYVSTHGHHKLYAAFSGSTLTMQKVNGTFLLVLVCPVRPRSTETRMVEMLRITATLTS